MDFNDKNVLITGGAGFIGSNLAHMLGSLGSDITIVDSFFPDGGANENNRSGYEVLAEHVVEGVSDPPNCIL